MVGQHVGDAHESKMDAASDLSASLRSGAATLAQQQQRIRNKRKSLGTQRIMPSRTRASDARRQSLDPALLAAATTSTGAVATVASVSDDASVTDVESTLNGGTQTLITLGDANAGQEDVVVDDDDVAVSELRVLLQRFGDHFFLFRDVIDDWHAMFRREVDQLAGVPPRTGDDVDTDSVSQPTVVVSDVHNHPATVFRDLQNIKQSLFKTKQKQAYISAKSHLQFLYQISALPPSFTTDAQLEAMVEECSQARDELWANKAKLHGQAKSIEAVCDALVSGYAALEQQVADARDLLTRMRGVDAKLSAHRSTVDKMEALKVEFRLSDSQPHITDSTRFASMDFVQRPDLRLDNDGEVLLARWQQYASVNSAETANAEDELQARVKVLKRIMSFRDKLRLIEKLRWENAIVAREVELTGQQRDVASADRTRLLGTLRELEDKVRGTEATLAAAQDASNRAQVLARASGPDVEALADWYHASLGVLAHTTST